MCSEKSGGGWWLRAAGRVALGLALALGAAPVLGGRQSPAPQTIALLATDDAVAARKTVAVLTDRNAFTQLFVPAGTPILRSGKRLSLARIKTGAQITCRGRWADASRSVFRASSVSVGAPLTPGQLRHRVALACRRVSVRPVASRSAPPRPHVRVAAKDDFVLEEWTLERDDTAAPAPDSEQNAYHARGVLRNISGRSFERVELSVSILDRDGRKLLDQSALAHNVRAGDRWKFTGTPTLYLPYKQGHTVRVDQIRAITE